MSENVNLPQKRCVHAQSITIQYTKRTIFDTN